MHARSDARPRQGDRVEVHRGTSSFAPRGARRSELRRSQSLIAPSATFASKIAGSSDKKKRESEGVAMKRSQRSWAFGMSSLVMLGCATNDHSLGESSGSGGHAGEGG